MSQRIGLLVAICAALSSVQAADLDASVMDQPLRGDDWLALNMSFEGIQGAMPEPQRSFFAFSFLRTLGILNTHQTPTGEAMQKVVGKSAKDLIGDVNAQIAESSESMLAPGLKSGMYYYASDCGPDFVGVVELAQSQTGPVLRLFTGLEHKFKQTDDGVLEAILGGHISGPTIYGTHQCIIDVHSITLKIRTKTAPVQGEVTVTSGTKKEHGQWCSDPQIKSCLVSLTRSVP